MACRVHDLDAAPHNRMAHWCRYTKSEDINKMPDHGRLFSSIRKQEHGESGTRADTQVQAKVLAHICRDS